MKSSAAPMTLSGSELGETRHVCAFFGSDDEEYRVLLPFITDGLDRGERAIHVLNPDQRREHLRRLDGAGVDAMAAEDRGQLELRTNTETYLRDGRFDQDRLLAEFESMATGAHASRFPRSRIVCRMDWAAGNDAFVDDLIEFESRVNDVWRRHDDAVICTYRAEQFSGQTVIGIVRTHPFVIIGGLLHRNPFFVPPERLVPALREKRAKEAAVHVRRD